MYFHVYMILAKVNGRNISYVGYTKNLKNRLRLHNSSKGAKFTRGKKWEIAHFKMYSSKNKAMKEEYLLKKNTKKRNMIKRNYLNNL